MSTVGSFRVRSETSGCLLSKRCNGCHWPVGEAADAVNQGHLSVDAARKVAQENGVRAADFDVIVANAGIPPGPQEALDWVNRA